MSRSFIREEKLITPETTWVLEKVGFKARYGVGKEFRFVFWKGFSTPTEERPDFNPRDKKRFTRNQEDLYE